MVHFGDLLANAESLVAKIQSADGVPPVQRGLTEIARESTALGADGGARAGTPARGGGAKSSAQHVGPVNPGSHTHVLPSAASSPDMEHGTSRPRPLASIA